MESPAALRLEGHRPTRVHRLPARLRAVGTLPAGWEVPSEAAQSRAVSVEVALAIPVGTQLKAKRKSQRIGEPVGSKFTTPSKERNASPQREQTLVPREAQDVGETGQ